MRFGEPGGLYAEFCIRLRRTVAIYLGPMSPSGSSGLPEDGAGRSFRLRRMSSYLALLRVGFARLLPLPEGPVRSYRTISPLPT